MRAVVIVAALTLLAGVVPVASAQPTAEPTEARVVDPAGDVRVGVGTSGLSTVPNADHIDVLAAWLANETATTLEFGFKLRRFDDPAANLLYISRYIQGGFSQGALQYRLWYPSFGGCRPAQASFSVTTTSSYLLTKCVSASIDATAGTARFSIPKEFILDERFAPIPAGTILNGLYIQANGPGWPSNVSDRAPDVGFGPVFQTRFGPGTQSGDLHLSAPEPVRSSNGEATSFLYPVQLYNAGTQERLVYVSAENSNPEWTIRVPAQIRIPAQGRLDFPVILSMNFSHQHGITKYFTLHAEAANDPAHAASLELGVHWLEIPQPAGHHDRVFFHSAPRTWNVIPHSVGGWTQIWMNAIEQDPNVTATDQEASARSTDGGLVRSNWFFPLTPALDIGLHFDESRAGTFTTKVRSTVPSSAATMRIVVYYCDLTQATAYWEWECPRSRPEAKLVLLTGAQTRPLAANGDTNFEIPLKLTDNATIIPFRPAARLVLHAELTAEAPQSVFLVEREPSARMVVKDTSLQLPLFEYHDPIDRAFENLGTLRLAALDGFQKAANPGRTAIFRFELTNEGKDRQKVVLGLEGVNAPWARILGDEVVEVAPGAKAPIAVAVEVPIEASPDEHAELFLVAESRNNASLSALSRFRVRVVDREVQEIPDEGGRVAALAPPDATPAPGVLVLLFGMCILAIARRTFARRSRKL